jgi:hypothetical protein
VGRRKVTAPDGRTWTLGRHWLPARKRVGRVKLRDLGDLTPSSLDGADDVGVLGAIVIAIVAVIALIVLALVLFNVVAIAIELALLVILLLAGVFGRVVLRRPWTVFARSGETLHTTQVKGWQASGRTIDELAQRIASGAQLEPAPGDRR